MTPEDRIKASRDRTTAQAWFAISVALFRNSGLIDMDAMIDDGVWPAPADDEGARDWDIGGGG